MVGSSLHCAEEETEVRDELLKPQRRAQQAEQNVSGSNPAC